MKTLRPPDEKSGGHEDVILPGQRVPQHVARETVETLGEAHDTFFAFTVAVRIRQREEHRVQLHECGTTKGVRIGAMREGVEARRECADDASREQVARRRLDAFGLVAVCGDRGLEHHEVAGGRVPQRIRRPR